MFEGRGKLPQGSKSGIDPSIADFLIRLISILLHFELKGFLLFYCKRKLHSLSVKFFELIQSPSIR